MGPGNSDFCIVTVWENLLSWNILLPKKIHYFILLSRGREKNPSAPLLSSGLDPSLSIWQEISQAKATCAFWRTPRVLRGQRAHFHCAPTSVFAAEKPGSGPSPCLSSCLTSECLLLDQGPALGKKCSLSPSFLISCDLSNFYFPLLPSPHVSPLWLVKMPFTPWGPLKSWSENLAIWLWARLTLFGLSANAGCSAAHFLHILTS